MNIILDKICTQLCQTPLISNVVLVCIIITIACRPTYIINPCINYMYQENLRFFSGHWSKKSHSNEMSLKYDIFIRLGHFSVGDYHAFLVGLNKKKEDALCKHQGIQGLKGWFTRLPRSDLHFSPCSWAL